MPRRKQERYGLAEDGNGNLTPVRVDGSSHGVPSLSGIQASEARDDAASQTFAVLLSREDGWLRAIPAGNGKLNYFKWKFSSGPHRGKYVMYVGKYLDWAESILGLAEKLDEVDRGVRKPSFDQYGGDGWDVT